MNYRLPLIGLLASASVAAAAAVTVPAPSGNGITLLSELDLTRITCFDDAGSTKVRANKTTCGGPISICDTIYESGIGTHAPSVACFRLAGADTFSASVGIDDDADEKDNHGVVEMTVTLYKDATPTEYRRATLNRTDASSYKLNIPLAGYDFLKIEFDQGTQPWADHVDLGSAFFIGGSPVTITEAEIGGTPSASDIVQLPAEGANGAEIVALSSLDISNMTTGWGTLKANKSIDGNTLTLSGVRYASGIGTHATGRIVVKINGAATKFHAVCGIDDEVGDKGDVNWSATLVGEGGSRKVAAEGHATGSSAADILDIDLVGWKYLILDVDQNGADAYDHFDWANAYFEYVEQNSNPPVTVPADILESGLEVAELWFAQPGVRMMQFVRNLNDDAEITVSGLPAGLTWNADRRCIEGTVEAEGEYSYTVTSANAAGEPDSRTVTLRVTTDMLMPTPAMGWMSWNAVQSNISEEIVRKVVKNFKEQGLYDAGYTLIMMDDWWHADSRNADGTPRPNPARFPNGIKAVADFVHDAGMTFGLYSDVAERTCAGAFGSHGYYETDARTYASWGIDMVKVDYCHAPADKATAIERYTTFINEFNRSGRRMGMFMCEWGQRDPWTWGAQAGAPTWRATYDSRDCWIGRGQGIGVTQSLNLMKDLWVYNGPNRFNDADMMCIGLHGVREIDGVHCSSSDLCVTGPGMTQAEYQTQMSMWCMWSSPLLLSHNAKEPMSDDDLRILTNPEIIAINQDRMGLAAQYLGTRDGYMLFAKDLENGDVAVAVVNLNDAAGSYTVDFSAIPALKDGGSYKFRDVWAHDDLGVQTGSYEIASIAPHATAVYRLTDADPSGIEETVTANADMKVTASDAAITVSGGVAGAAKRVIVADIAGRLMGQATSSDDVVTIPVSAPRGTLLTVTMVSGGRAQSAKIIL